MLLRFNLFRSSLYLIALLMFLPAQAKQLSKKHFTVTVIATYTLNSKETPVVTKIIGELVAQTRRETGNLEYEAYRYIAHPRQIVFIERWINQAAHTAHHHRANIVALHKQLKPYLMYQPRFDRLYTYQPFEQRWQVRSPA